MSSKLHAQEYCPACGGTHEDMGTLCSNVHCGLCFRLCIRESACTWKDETRNYIAEKAADAELMKQANAPTVSSILENVALNNLKEAFVCWYASTNDDVDDAVGEALWKEFELFAREILTPVDAGKQYLIVKRDENNKPEIEFLDGSNLFKNQDGEYVQVQGKKRVRIGKNVAVMG